MSFAGTDSEEDGTPDHDEPAVQHDQARSGESHVGHDRQGGGPAHDVTCQRGEALTDLLKKLAGALNVAHVIDLAVGIKGACLDNSTNPNII